MLTNPYLILCQRSFSVSAAAQACGNHLFGITALQVGVVDDVAGVDGGQAAAHAGIDTQQVAVYIWEIYSVPRSSRIQSALAVAVTVSPFAGGRSARCSMAAKTRSARR